MGEEKRYINNLLEYLDKPESIQHITGANVRALHHFPNHRYPACRIVVVFENGSTDAYFEDGRYHGSSLNSSFILKPGKDR